MDMEFIFNYLIKECKFYYEYILEGWDDMFVYVKVIIIGVSFIIFIIEGWLNMGIWQGIYFCEFCNYGGGCKIVVIVMGE